MINLPNGETWENEGENSELAIAWVRSMFVDAADSSISINDHLARGEKVNKNGMGYYHSTIVTLNLSPNLRISCGSYYKSTMNFIIEEI